MVSDPFYNRHESDFRNNRIRPVTNAKYNRGVLVTDYKKNFNVQNFLNEKMRDKLVMHEIKSTDDLLNSNLSKIDLSKMKKRIEPAKQHMNFKEYKDNTLSPTSLKTKEFKQKTLQDEFIPDMSIYNLVKPDDVKSDIYRYYMGKSQLKKQKKVPASELAPSQPT